MILDEFDDWCISENAIWGIPIPFFKYKDSDEILIDNEIVDHVAKVFQTHGGSDSWYTLPIHDLLPRRYKD